MDINYGYIYLRRHESYDIYGVYKLGKTKNIPDRDSIYKTGECENGEFILVLKMESHIDDYVEKILHKGFYNLRLKKNKEFFKSNHRLSMMVRSLEKMDGQKLNSHLDLGELVRSRITE